MYADAYLAQTDGAYSAACGRRVPSRQVPQAPSMTSGLLRRTGSRPCSRLAGSLSVLFFGGVRCGGLPGGDGPSALRWMAAKAEFPCGLTKGGGIGAGVDVLWCFLWSFCVIFKFIFGVFWIIIMEKDGWPDWLRLTD